jgi:hypothetical protein
MSAVQCCKKIIQLTIKKALYLRFGVILGVENSYNRVFGVGDFGRILG